MNLMQILTNENPILINIIKILFSIPQALLFYLITCLVTNTHNKKNRRIILFISTMTLCGTLTILLPNSIIKDALVLVVQAISIKLILNTSTKNMFISLISSYIVTFFSDYISTSLFIYVLKISQKVILDIPLYLFLAYFTSIMIMYFIIKILYLITDIKENKTKTNFIYDTRLILNMILGIIMLLVESYLFSIYIDTVPIKLALSIVLATLIYFTFTIYTLFRTNKLEKTEEELENEKLYNKTLTILHDNIRGFKHDFNNIVQAIGGYVSLKDIEGLQKYYERLLEECKLTNNLNLLNPETINNPSIYSLLTNKYFVSTEKGITMNFSIFSDLSGISTNMYEISRILGILLDNAIEAAEETEEKLVDIEIKSDDKKHIFIIKNSCKDPNISTTKIFEKGYSTKNRDSGFGLWNVHKILSKNTNLDLYTTIDGNMFSQKFTIYK